MLSLQNILRFNGINTTLAGLILFFLPNTFANWFGLPEAGYFIATGVFFALFGIYVLYVARKESASRNQLAFITFVDWTWVAFSLILILALFNTITAAGLAIIATIAIWVAVMAYLEGEGLRRESIA